MFDLNLIETLSSNPEEQVFIRRLAEHRPEIEADEWWVNNHSISTVINLFKSVRKGFPPNRQAAVLVLLYVRDNHVRVLLTTRSKSLRSHPGQVALPGGRCDPEDESMASTAVSDTTCSLTILFILWNVKIREAHEEVGLARSHPHIHILTTLAPFLSQFRLLVTPVIGWATSPEFLRELKANEGEVDEIWEHPLEAVLSPELVCQPNLLTRELAEKGTEGWPYESDIYVRLCSYSLSHSY